MTERFAVVLLFGALPLFFAGSYPVAFACLALYNTLAFSVWAWDLRQASTEQIACRRDHERQWLLHRTERIVLAIGSQSGHALAVDVREALPANCEPGELPSDEPVISELALAGASEVALAALGVGLPGGASDRDLNRSQLAPRKLDELPWEEEPEEERPPARLPVPLALQPRRLALPAYGQVRLSYGLTPAVRGELELGPVHVRILGPLGLAFRQRTIDVPSRVEVVAALPAATKLGQIDPRPSIRDSGQIVSRAKGSGLELESLREYVPGDEFRKIAWKASARKGRQVVKELHSEVSQQMILLVDSGRRMGMTIEAASRTRHVPGAPGAPAGAGSLPGLEPPPPTRFARALDGALVLARAALKQGDRVGFLTFADTVDRWLKPTRSKKQWFTLAQEAQRLAPSQRPSDYGQAVTHVLTQVRRRSLCVLLTDVPSIDGIGPMKETLALLASRHRVLVVTVCDPDLKGMAESPAPGGRPLERSAAVDLLGERQVAITEISRCGVPVIDLEPSRLTLAALRSTLAAAGRRRRR